MKLAANTMKKYNHLIIIAIVLISAILLLFYMSSINDGYKTATKAVTKELPQPTGKISFATWGNPKEMEILKLVAKEFFDRYNIMVDVFCFSDIESCRARIISQFAAGDPFDVFCADKITFSILSQKDYLLDISRMVNDKRIRNEDYYNSAFNKGFFEGRLLGIPAAVNPSVIYYNASLFKEAGMASPEDYYKNNGWNQDALNEVCKGLKKIRNIYGMAIKNDWETVFSIVNNDEGSQVNFDKDGTILAADSSIQSVRLFKSMIDNNYCIYMGGMPKGVTEDELFKSQRVGMVYADYSYAYLLKDIKDFKWDIVPFPSKGKGCGINAIDVPLIAAAKYARDDVSAEDFILFYTGSQGQKLRLEKGERTLPSLKYTVYNDTVFPDHSNYYFYSLAEGAMEPDAYNYLQNKDKLLARFNDFWNGRTGLESIIRPY